MFMYQENQVELLKAKLKMNCYYPSNPLFAGIIPAHLRKDAGKVGHESSKPAVFTDTASEDQAK